MNDEVAAVLGGGNGGQCMAADLALAGQRVVLYEHPRFAESLGAVLDEARIELEGIGRTGRAALEAATTSAEEALDRARVLHLVVPAVGQEAFFDEIIPHLRDDHVVVIWAGDFGSLRLDERLRRERPDAKVDLYETHTLPYGTRLEGPGRVRLLLTAPIVLIAALPGIGTESNLGTLSAAFPCLRPADNVLVTALNNPNPIVHPAGCLLNTGTIQNSPDFHLYGHGMSEAVARVVRGVFEEVAALAASLGFRLLEYEDRDFRTPASIMGVAFEAPFDTVGVIGEIAGPHSLEDRYLTEDLPFGLVPVDELAEKAGLELPLVRSLIDLGSAVCGRDFRAEGRGLDRLGLAALEVEEILEHVNVGGSRAVA